MLVSGGLLRLWIASDVNAEVVVRVTADEAAEVDGVEPVTAQVGNRADGGKWNLAERG
jgi:hypothetical protein